MKVFVTKYVLSTKKIEEAETDDDVFGNGMIVVRKNGYTQVLHKRDWFLTREEAAANAEARRIKKIASVKKQLAKLESMTF